MVNWILWLRKLTSEKSTLCKQSILDLKYDIINVIGEIQNDANPWLTKNIWISAKE